jgi:hypothetical protein
MTLVGAVPPCGFDRWAELEGRAAATSGYRAPVMLSAGTTRPVDRMLMVL